MKEKILDTPFMDSFQDVLKKDEQVLWRGSPAKHRMIISHQATYGIVLLTGLGFMLFVEVYIDKNFPISSTLLGIILLLNYFLNKTSNRDTQYLITQHRILFNQSQLYEPKIHEISFSEIKNCKFNSNNYGLGTIFLVVEDLSQIQFETYKDDEVDVRPQPTLELVEDVNHVVEIIRQQIEKAK